MEIRPGNDGSHVEAMPTSKLLSAMADGFVVSLASQKGYAKKLYVSVY
jgi:hypothetical protein